VHADPVGSADRTARHPLRHPQRAHRRGRRLGPGRLGEDLGDLFAEAGHSCAAYGKWHIGEGTGRSPTDHGSQEWYGPPRTYDEALWPTDPWTTLPATRCRE
jgi:arylsulfatase A-like enzyme